MPRELLIPGSCDPKVEVVAPAKGGEETVWIWQLKQPSSSCPLTYGHQGSRKDTSAPETSPQSVPCSLLHSSSAMVFVNEGSQACPAQGLQSA